LERKTEKRQREIHTSANLLHHECHTVTKDQTQASVLRPRSGCYTMWENRVFWDVKPCGQIVSFGMLHCVDKSCLLGCYTVWANCIFWDVTPCGKIVSFGMLHRVGKSCVLGCYTVWVNRVFWDVIPYNFCDFYK